jgi:DNA-binding MarR family transcriptional regulator
MTQTQPDSSPARPAISAGQAIGQAVGQAQSVLSGVLVEKVAQAGTTRENYLALQRLGVLGDAAATDAYVRDLADWLDLDVRSAGDLADGLAAAGLVSADDGAVEVTADGEQLRANVAGLISAVTAPLYEGLSPADVETTVRTLRGLTTGVRAALAAGRDQERARPGAGS